MMVMVAGGDHKGRPNKTWIPSVVRRGDAFYGKIVVNG